MLFNVILLDRRKRSTSDDTPGRRLAIDGFYVEAMFGFLDCTYSSNVFTCTYVMPFHFFVSNNNVMSFPQSLSIPSR